MILCLNTGETFDTVDEVLADMARSRVEPSPVMHLVVDQRIVALAR